MISRVIAALRYIWSHEPIRILYLVGVAANLAYQQLSAGVALEDVAVAVVIALVGELGRKTVSSPATVTRLTGGNTE